MKILAIDTSNHPLSIALVEDQQMLCETTLNLTKNHSIFVMPTIDQLMKIAGWRPTDLDRIVVAKGPGSYTGVRIAVTTAKTLADTLDIDLVGVSSLEVVAAPIAQTEPDRPVVTIFNARRNNVFAGGYMAHDGKINTWLDQRHTSLDELVKEINQRGVQVYLVGEITDDFKQIIHDEVEPKLVKIVPQSLGIPSAYQLALIGENAEPVKQLDEFIPDYLCITEAEFNWQKKHPGESKESYVREV
ncbi:tRNA (adenosine(37)-N6)-threonylcarbamoyltransferase complex dimerization subunit type 1 TsaB [Paucilactobacillus suebicus]|uniref:Peptidase M22, glycoprotease n=1 Tax=Paucilactobacillus suebicus DSM 5007 = KCTC 3549 TaxID=1423807 RepID=A0A0R1W7X7_9LACO|nr:tRNA (adenosine(37)-N6)-threonylcarbamoyltransferase complex dimerization subunit type 1 TsaB [Paucilactobacillus suebicus]KRM13615.1 peptidase M22, glycoprotease [Paucilactobacillus suebicus DSM 5007 = KCTC 3549]